MKKIAPTLHKVSESPFFIPVARKAMQAELRALLSCARALRKLRAAGGAWDVEARGLADRALAKLDGRKP